MTSVTEISFCWSWKGGNDSSLGQGILMTGGIPILKIHGTVRGRSEAAPYTTENQPNSGECKGVTSTCKTMFYQVNP